MFESDRNSVFVMLAPALASDFFRKAAGQDDFGFGFSAIMGSEFTFGQASALSAADSARANCEEPMASTGAAGW